MSNAQQQGHNSMPSYKGDISCKKGWDILAENPDAVLVDVRTKAEWEHIGTPDLSSINKKPVFLEWITFPEMAANPTFRAELSEKIPEKSTPLLFLCKVGGRSMQAAGAMAALGYSECYNLADGFEGQGNNRGWVAAQLPWRKPVS